jgi:formamidopyrimidine-DNA glycosylase
VRISGLRLRGRVPRDLPRRLAGHRLTAVGRHGKYLLMKLDGGITLISHLGMSGRWLFHPRTPAEELPHVHARIQFRDGSELWFQDPRRFGLLRAVHSGRLHTDPSLAVLGPDPIAEPPTGVGLRALAGRGRVAVKTFLLDQSRIPGIGNIYASEILHRAGVDPRTRAGAVALDRWEAIAREIGAVLSEAIERFGTTFSMYRTLWNEPGSYGDQLRVYDRSGKPCQTCGTPIRRIVQGARATYFCPRCQSRGRQDRARPGRPGRRRH